MKNMTSILNTQELVKHYGSGEGVVKAVDHTSLEVRRGEFTAIVGRSVRSLLRERIFFP